MRLLDLDPQFLRVSQDDEGREIHRFVETLAEAQGIRFLCPKCFEANGGAVGTHQIKCWSESAGAPATTRPGPGRWKMEGSGLGDLTLNADPPRTARSIQLNGGCNWHGYITNGEATSA